MTAVYIDIYDFVVKMWFNMVQRYLRSGPTRTGPRNTPPLVQSLGPSVQGPRDLVQRIQGFNSSHCKMHF